MSRCHAAARPLAKQLRQPCALRSFTSGASRAAEVQEQAAATPQELSGLDLDPNTVSPEFEAQLAKAGKMPIGSRRRRLALRTTSNIPFEQLPYQAFQEARKILAADRLDKLAKIKLELEKLDKLERTDAAAIKGGQQMKDTKLASLRREVERLKLLADANDPLVKKTFEDGLGDMNKPIYRALAEKKWRAYDYRLTAQRIEQFSIVPDVLPKLDPRADVQLFFRRAKVAPGDVVPSLTSEVAPRLRVQVFDPGQRLVTVVVVDADVPALESDGFTKRCHYLAANIPLSPADTSLPLGRIRADDQLAVPWLPAFSQKGAPYHRLGIFLLEQRPGETVDVAKLRELYGNNNKDNSQPGDDGSSSSSSSSSFSLKSMRDKFGLTPFGFTMFRAVWDENTAAVMARHGIPGADVELRPTRVYSLKPPVKPRGWEAKRQGPKYRHLWKYTKRIKGISTARGWIKRR